MVLNVNTNAAVIFAAKLDRMSRSALPVAVRASLNSAAFDVKQTTMPASAKKEFINRSPNFFKANSRVEMAIGFDINSMQSKVGFIENNLKGKSNFAVSDLEQQEEGGNIKKRSFIPLTPARGGNSNTKLVRPNSRLAAIKKIIDARRLPGKSDAQKFVYAFSKASVGSMILANFKGKTILWKVNSLNRTKKGNFKLTPVYSFSKNRSVHVKATHFIREASIKSGKDIENIFVRQAEKQLNKL